MIVTHKKDINQIKSRIHGKKNLIIVGCSECAAVCHTGGSEQVTDMVKNLPDNDILATISIESPCDKRITARDMRRITEEIDRADAIVALTCGSGVQAIHEVTGKPVIAALNTDFLGMVERLGKFYERCSHCGDCMLNDTAGLCPITLCPKSIKNGPCEGIKGTNCEVIENYQCVWHSIYMIQKERNELSNFTIFHKPSACEKNHLPRVSVWEKN
jgi:ferredoxin